MWQLISIRTFAVSVLLVVFCVTPVAFAQTEKAPPEPATDEYGIPLKLQSPRRVDPQTAMSTSSPALSPASVPSADAKIGSRASTGQVGSLKDEYGMPIRKVNSRRRQVQRSDSASGKALLSASGRRRNAMPRGSKAAPRVVNPEVLENKANQELVLPKADLSSGVLPTPATVRSRILEVQNPIRLPSYRVGVSFQPLTPKGTMQVGDLTPYDTAQAGTRPMVAIDAQWLPMTINAVSGMKLGIFGSAGFAQYALDIRTPAGISLEDSRLQVLKFQVGATASYMIPRAPLWNLHAQLGGGRLVDIQSSSASYANSSSSVDFASLGISGERSIWPSVSVYAGYDLRLALDRSTAGADVSNHNVLLGFLGNFE